MGRNRNRSKVKFYVPLQKWKAFEIFLNLLEDLEFNLELLEDGWEKCLGYLADEYNLPNEDFTDITDPIIVIRDILTKFKKAEAKQEDYKTYSTQNQIQIVPPQKKKKPKCPQIAEIIIEEITNGRIGN